MQKTANQPARDSPRTRSQLLGNSNIYRQRVTQWRAATATGKQIIPEAGVMAVTESAAPGTGVAARAGIGIGRRNHTETEAEAAPEGSRHTGPIVRKPAGSKAANTGREARGPPMAGDQEAHPKTPSSRTQSPPNAGQNLGVRPLLPLRGSGNQLVCRAVRRPQNW